MKLLTTLLLAVFVLLALFRQQQVDAALSNPGLVTYLDPVKITTFATTLVKMAFNDIKKAPIADVSGKTSIWNQRITNLDLRALKVSSKSVGGKPILSIDLSNFELTYTAKASHRIKILFIRKTFKTDVTVVISNCNVNVSVNPVINANKALGFNVVSSFVHIGTLKIKLHSHNLIVKILNAISGLFKNKIRAAVNKSMTNGLDKSVRAMAIQSASTIPAKFKVGSTYMSLALQDFQTNQYIMAAFDMGLVGSTSSVPRTSFQMLPSPNLFKIIVGTWPLNQLLDVDLTQKKKLNHYLTTTEKAQLPAASGFVWDFADQRYPLTVQKTYATVYEPSSTVTWDQVSLDATPGSLKIAGVFNHKIIAVNKATKAQGPLVSHYKCTVGQSSSITIQRRGADDFVVAQFPDLAVQCTAVVGDQLSINFLTSIINWTAKNLALPSINAVLAEGTLIPKPQGMGLKNVHIDIIQNAMQVSADVVFG